MLPCNTRLLGFSANPPSECSALGVLSGFGTRPAPALVPSMLLACVCVIAQRQPHCDGAGTHGTHGTDRNESVTRRRLEPLACNRCRRNGTM